MGFPLVISGPSSGVATLFTRRIPGERTSGVFTKMNARRPRQRRGGGRRTAATTRQAVNVTLTRYIPPAVPRPRERALKLRCCIQHVVNMTGSGNKEVSVLPSIFFDSAYSTTGFDAILVHRIAVWSSGVAPAQGQDEAPEIVVHYRQPDNTEVYPSFSNTAPGYNLASRIGFHVPAHMAGPWPKNGTVAFLRIAGNDVTIRAMIELDCTFI